MPFDPLTFWMKGSTFWAKVFRQQQQAYLKMLCNMANAVPQGSAAEIAAEAESLRSAAPKPTPLHRRPRVAKPAASAKPAEAKRAESVTA